MRYDFHELKTVTAHDAITLRVPKRWDAEDDADGARCYYETGADTGMLWIVLRRFREPRDADILSYAEGNLEHNRAKHDLLVDDPIEEIENGYRWVSVYNVDDDGRPERYFRFDLFVKRDREWCFINFILVLDRSQADHPDFHPLLEILEREIGDARIDVFANSAEPEPAADSPLDSVSPVSFGGIAEMTLPDAVDWSELEDSAQQGRVRYVGQLDRAGSRAFIHVKGEVLEHALKDGTVDADAREHCLLRTEEWTATRPSAEEIEPVPCGAIEYREFAETAETVTDREPAYRHEWAYFRCDDGVARELTVMFVLPDTDSDAPPFAGLAAIVDKAVRQANFLQYRAEEENKIPMRYDFDRLKPVTCYDAITLRIPARWDVSEDNGDMWGYYQEEDENRDDTDTGTLWISLDNYFPRDPNEAMGLDIAKEILDGVIDSTRQRGKVVSAEPIQEIDGGYLWTHTDEAEEKGEALKFIRYHYYMSDGRGVAMITFSLVLTVAQLDDPEFRDLIAIMNREIRGARLDPFKERQRDRDEKSFGPLHLCNFYDLVKLMLPQSIELSGTDAGNNGNENQWYGRFQTENSYAALFVIVVDRRIRHAEVEGVVMRTEDRDIPLDPTFPSKDIHNRDVPLPWSKVLYEVTEDRKEGEEVRIDSGPEADHPLQHHFWRHCYFADMTARELQVILMVPLAAKDERPYQDFIAYLDREVRRAIFPGLTPEQPAMKERTT